MQTTSELTASEEGVLGVQRQRHPPDALESRFLPKVSSFLKFGFERYVDKLIARRFHAVRIVRGTVPEVSGPLLLYVNHIGWWDPLMAVLLTKRLFGPRQFYAPIARAGFEQHAILGRLGFFPIDLASVSGARDFLRTARAILKTDAAFWMTPEGRFADAREFPGFEHGLGHLVSSRLKVTVIPVAVEYPFWFESKPESLIQFGVPFVVDDHSPTMSKQEWTHHLETRLRETQKSLAEKAIGRREEEFEALLCSGVGAGGMYEALRRTFAWVTGREHKAEHAEVVPRGARP